MKHNPVYDKIDGMKYRYLESIATDMGFTPPDGKDIVLQFGVWSANGVLTLLPGNLIDGATYAFDTPGIIGPAGNHDFGCYLVNRRLIPFSYRAKFDAAFKKQCAENGIPDMRVEWLGDAVSIYGKIVTPVRLRLRDRFPWLAKLLP